MVKAEEQINNEQPSMDFLEFLGEWQTNNGESIDPIEFDDEKFAESIEQHSEDEENE